MFRRGYGGDRSGPASGRTALLPLETARARPVFERDGGTVRHFWGAELTYAPLDPGQDHRSFGTLEPLWNMFDLTRVGRPE
jgi:predicted dithiol-disulfide oxidoreductase (DUF899 family)